MKPLVFASLRPVAILVAAVVSVSACSSSAAVGGGDGGADSAATTPEVAATGEVDGVSVGVDGKAYVVHVQRDASARSLVQIYAGDQDAFDVPFDTSACKEISSPATPAPKRKFILEWIAAELKPGTYPVCNGFTNCGKDNGRIQWGMSNEPGYAYGGVRDADDGELTIESFDGKRLKGTFRATWSKFVKGEAQGRFDVSIDCTTQDP